MRDGRVSIDVSWLRGSIDDGEVADCSFAAWSEGRNDGSERRRLVVERVVVRLLSFVTRRIESSVRVIAIFFLFLYTPESISKERARDADGRAWFAEALEGCGVGGGRCRRVVWWSCSRRWRELVGGRRRSRSARIVGGGEREGLVDCGTSRGKSDVRQHLRQYVLSFNTHLRSLPQHQVDGRVLRAHDDLATPRHYPSSTVPSVRPSREASQTASVEFPK